jgi:DNA (cytosine-5)-methyltransferase 1
LIIIIPKQSSTSPPKNNFHQSAIISPSKSILNIGKGDLRKIWKSKQRNLKMDKLKVLNLYAGIGGNRKLWTDVDVTAVEMNPEIAAIYSDLYPQDKMIIGDAHAYLLEHFKDFDFIWASPPCPTHSRFNNLNQKNIKYPDMALYQEIIVLQHFFEGKYCIENVITYYDPLIKPFESNSHYFWANFKFRQFPNEKRGIRRQEHDFRYNRVGIDLSKYNLEIRFEKQIINNCVEPEIALHILNCARGVMEAENINQPQLF